MQTVSGWSLCDNGSTWNKLGNNDQISPTERKPLPTQVPVQQRDHRRSDQTDHLYHPCRQQPSKKSPSTEKTSPDNQVWRHSHFRSGTKQEFVVEQANVETATIENQTWGVKLTENKLIVTAPNKRARERIRRTDLHQIFSKKVTAGWWNFR